jgi:hypothetical protein
MNKLDEAPMRAMEESPRAFDAAQTVTARDLPGRPPGGRSRRLSLRAWRRGAPCTLIGGRGGAVAVIVLTAAVVVPGCCPGRAGRRPGARWRAGWRGAGGRPKFFAGV